MEILNRESADINLENYIIMPPHSAIEERGNNILHINTKNRHYRNNKSSIEFVNEVLSVQQAKVMDSDAACLKYGVEHAMSLGDGVFLEFGFCTGTTINFIAALAYNREVFGFDSLTGLPENWRPGFPKNVFGYKSIKRWPFIPLANTSLVIGDIDETLDVFVDDILKQKSVSFIHIDTDTFAAAQKIYEILGDYIEPEKTVIALDEGYNFSDDTRADGDNEWTKHEYAATIEFAVRRNYVVNFLAYNENHQQLIITFSRKEA